MKRLMLLLPLILATTRLVAATNELSADDLAWREKTGYNPQVHGTVANSGDADVFARLPYAYFPYDNELEVVFDLATALKLLPPGSTPPRDNPDSLTVRIIQKEGQRKVAEGVIPLDAKGRGHGLINLADVKAAGLPEGVYQVEYEFGGARLMASRTFRRTCFGFERNTLGLAHKVYPPFTPVKIDGRKVSVVGRTYTINAQGLFDSVIANGRELLAEPMKLVVVTEDGKRVEWKEPGWFGRSVKGKVLYPDLAEFRTEAEGSGFGVQGKMEIEEDGCAKIALTLNPEPRTHPTLSRAWLEMALKESEAPLCHMVGMNSMRHNYAGKVPRGGRITWLNQPWRPARFEVKPFSFKEMLPVSYQVWEANNQMHWGGQRWNFAPYVWLGAEERGLAWFGDYTGGYSHDGTSSLQRIFIEPGKVVLRVDLIQKPTDLTTARTFEFGLQASPTKPLPTDWRTYDVPGGGGMSVVVWGGFNCSSKYPVNHDWSIVDKIMEGRGSGKADYAFLQSRVEKHGLQDAKANGQPWLTAVSHFAGKEAGAPHPNGTTVYFEEHQTNGDHPEMIEYMDEWADTTWSRFRYFDYSGHQEGLLEKGTWGPEVRSANSRSYRDFAVYMANEWMRRGVGIYYDNTYPMTDYNRRHFDRKDIAWSSSLWGHRDYYKRVWKQSRELMEKGLTPLDPVHQKKEPGRRIRLNVVGHVTNCQVLPYTTWWDATLGVESPGQWQPDVMPSAEQRTKALKEWPFLILPGPNKDSPGQALPYPPDYLRAMEMGRMAGLIPHYRHLLRSEDAFGGIGIGYGSTDQGKDPAVREHRYLSDAAMGLIHEIRGGASGYDHPEVGALRRIYDEFRNMPGVITHNYWEEKPFAQVGHADIKWIALSRDPSLNPEPRTLPSSSFFGLLVLQSYRSEANGTKVRFPGTRLYVDILRRETFAADANGDITIPLAADYGTRVLLMASAPEAVRLLPRTADTLFVEDFETGRSPGTFIKGNPDVIPDPLLSGNHVIRFVPAHPAQNVFSVMTPDLSTNGSTVCEFKFRLPVAPEKSGKQGLLQVGYRKNDNKRYGLAIGLAVTTNLECQFTASEPRLGFDGGKSQPMQTTSTFAGGNLGDPRLKPCDWHTVTIRAKGQRHTLLLDGTPFYEGEDGVNLAGGLELAPGWELRSDSPVPLVEVDDIRIMR